MSITISPLNLVLDTQNPRFIILARREQVEIRKYLVTYEDVCQLATNINEYGSLLLGERIVVLQENENYVVIEGNRRTCSLQLLLSRDLIPDGFAHRIPHASEKILANCRSIEVDILPDRDAALELMTKRHIQGVKEWKPLAKKQFFAANYKDGHGQSVQNLSRITGINEGEIKKDIRDYKFFSNVYEKYCANHPDFNKEIIVLKTDPFWRIFKAKFECPVGTKVSPKDFLKIYYDDTFNTVSTLTSMLFENITQLVFKKSIVEERITTRHVLTDVEGIRPLLQAVIDEAAQNDGETYAGDSPAAGGNGTQEPPADEGNGGHSPQGGTMGGRTGGQNGNFDGDNADGSGGPRPGGPPPRSFFETISWRDKLSPTNKKHQGLLHAINELYNLSNTGCGRQKAYRIFPIATGMILRTAYEQALLLRLMQVNLWGTYLETRRDSLITLKTMEDFINAGRNKATVFPDQEMVRIYDRVIAATHRDFLNANIHCPGKINVTADSLEAIAAGGMHALIQGIIDLIA